MKKKFTANDGGNALHSYIYNSGLSMDIDLNFVNEILNNCELEINQKDNYN